MPFDPSRMMGGANVGVERQAQLHAHRTRIDQASSALRQSQSALKEIDAKLRDTKSIAPFDGVLLKKHVEVGDTVQPGQPLVNFADTSILQIQADIAARLATGLREGTEITARLDDPNKTRATVRVAQIFPTADPVRHTIRMKFDLPMNAPVAPGMYADVLIPDPNARGMELPVIPLAAIVWRGGLPMVEVINPQGGTQLRLLRLGDPVDADQVTVLTGIREGEHIVIQRSR
jgi:RND family efflux transporter MFP subunit